MPPLLSICVPTYNRAELLRAALLALAPQVKELQDQVELIVSDNCSPDHTPEVVAQAQQYVPIRYHRNAQNVGAGCNIMLLANELAVGEFVWILPDDDIARPDAVKRIVAVLRQQPDISYLFVNISPRSSATRTALGRPCTAADFPELEPTKCKDLTEHRVDRWEELIDPAIDEVFLGSLMCSVFRLSVWKKHRLCITPNDLAFLSLEATYTHTVILAHTMRGQPAYYLGYPCVITFWGGQEWTGYVPVVHLLRLQDLLDLFLQLGIDRRRVDKCRSTLLGYSQGALRKILFDRTTPGRQYFSLFHFLLRNRRHPLRLFWLLLSMTTTFIPRPLYNFLRSVKRNIRSFFFKQRLP